MSHSNVKKPIDRNPSAAGLIWDAMEALTEGLAIFDADHNLITCNQRFVDMFPLISDLIDRHVPWADLLRAGAERGQYVEALGRVDDWVTASLGAGVPLGQTVEIELTNGAIYTAQFSAIDNSGFIVAYSDITERRQAEAVAREQEAILRTVLETSPVAVVMARLEDGRILYRSPGAVEFFGNTRSALEHYVDPRDRETYIDELVRKGRVEDYNITLINAEGKHCATTSWGRLVDFEGDTYVVTAIMDLSERNEREALIRQVLEACPAPIQMTKADTGEVLFSSPETLSLFGAADNARSFYADRNSRADYLEKLKKNRSVSEYKTQYINADGHPFWGSVSARMIRFNGEDVIVSHTRDLTDQLQIENELSQQREQLFQNEKLSAMGELLAGVAHELNNPLSVVVGHSLMLREDCTDEDTLRQVEKISAAAERCARIVKTFLTMARQKPVGMQRADIGEIVQTAVDVARFGDTAVGLTIDCELAPALPPICVDPDQITQVLVNLILNAEQAMRDSGQGGRVTVSAHPARRGDGVEISVQDDGPGIPEAIRSRVFEPFFTTKDVGDGTGIGLALCHRIVRSHQGRITVEAGPDGGTMFRIVLPRHAADATPTPDTPNQHVPTRSARILIVDDEEDVAELNAEILTRSGYAVDVFNDARDALDSMHDRDYDLILSDLNMPDIDGRAFYELMRRDFPHLIDRLGFVTGDTMGRSSQSLLKEANRPYAEKPVSPKELRTFVTDILSTAEQGQS